MVASNKKNSSLSDENLTSMYVLSMSDWNLTSTYVLEKTVSSPPLVVITTSYQNDDDDADDDDDDWFLGEETEEDIAITTRPAVAATTTTSTTDIIPTNPERKPNQEELICVPTTIKNPKDNDNDASHEVSLKPCVSNDGYMYVDG